MQEQVATSSNPSGAVALAGPAKALLAGGRGADRAPAKYLPLLLPAPARAADQHNLGHKYKALNYAARTDKA